jgi:hypothetical protein
MMFVRTSPLPILHRKYIFFINDKKLILAITETAAENSRLPEVIVENVPVNQLDVYG